MTFSTFDFDDMDKIVSMYNLEERNAAATEIIERYSKIHIGIDVVIGLFSMLPIPGLGLFGIAGAIFAQIPIYQELAKELGGVYSSYPDSETGQIIFDGFIDASVEIIVAEFTIEFLTEIAKDLLREIGYSALIIAIVPVIGGVVAAAIDAKIAATMTWRVGTMISIYYQNGQEFVGDRGKTYELSSELTGEMSTRVKGRVDLNRIPDYIGEVEKRQIQAVTCIVEMILAASPNATEDDVFRALLAKNVPVSLIHKVINLIDFRN